MTASPVLRIDAVQISFGSMPVLLDVGLEVPEGSFTAVLGSSGSGKTTLLRTIAGFQRPDSGTVELTGRIVDDAGRHVPPERRKLGYVPQEGALFPHLTVAGNVGFGLRRRTRTTARVEKLLDLVGLVGLNGRYPHELSGGQQQRVALARALALEPSLVLLDEPFASLDAALRASVRADIARVLRAAGTSVVLVTHDQQEALSLADQVAVLRDGRIAQIGSPRDIYNRPVDPDMAAFLGEANLVRTTLHGANAVTALGTLTTQHHDHTHGIVLIRPEQIAILADGVGGGLPATVVEQTYHGHDSMLTVRPLHDCGVDVLRVRVSGTTTFRPADEVRLSASGSAPTWTTETSPPTPDPTPHRRALS
jgi:iron(III) transport system ATP-binding protein